MGSTFLEPEGSRHNSLDSLENHSSPVLSSTTTNERHFCVVCGDESDGLHFGQYTCRACAAFFRRTVSLKLHYTCKHEKKCSIEKSARNMCRSCRFEKCIQQGMLTTAVQHARDGLGKRKEVQKLSTSSDTPDIKVPKAVGSPPFGQSVLQLPPAPNFSFGPPTLVEGASTYMVHNSFANLQLGTQNSAFTALVEPVATEMKYLSKMLEGYQHFLSLRKASYTLIEGLPRFLQNEQQEDEIPQSNFGTSKKICKIEASLIMDTVEKFFIPFSSLSLPDKNQLFDSFYCLFSNTERAFRTYKTFPANDNRLLMPDGGYIRLSELSKFYENNTLVRGDPTQVAKIFESAMSYVVNVVVAHMRNINITEVELMALFGMFIWKDTVSVSPETMAIVLQTRDNILIDLHTYYRSTGLLEAEITLKTSKLFFLLPKLETSTKLLKENFHIAELFNMMQLDACCRKINNCT